MNRFLDSSIGRKTIMAATGLLLIGFLFAHLWGNLKLFADRDGTAFVAYTLGLHGWGVLLWLAEIALFALFALHIYMGIRVTIRNRSARPHDYVLKKTFGSSNLASKSMMITGTVIFVFLVVHLINLRFAEGWKPIEAQSLWARTLETLRNPLFAFIYLAGSLAIGVHLWHGFASAFRSLGVWHPRINKPLRFLGYAIAVVLAMGFAAFPFVVLFFWRA